MKLTQQQINDLNVFNSKLTTCYAVIDTYEPLRYRVMTKCGTPYESHDEQFHKSVDSIVAELKTTNIPFTTLHSGCQYKPNVPYRGCGQLQHSSHIWLIISIDPQV